MIQIEPAHRDRPDEDVVLGHPDQADELLALEREIAQLLEAEGRMHRKREHLRVRATRLRLRLRPEEARRFEALKASETR